MASTYAPSRPVTPLTDAVSLHPLMGGGTFLAEGYPDRDDCSVHSEPERSEKVPSEPEYFTEEYIPEDIRPHSFLSRNVSHWRNVLPPSPAPPVYPKITSPPSEQMEETSIKGPKFYRCMEFFFEDANIVLVSDENVAFGVHRGVMKRLSIVFYHMFQDVHETPDMEMFQGLSLVKLSDTTEDLLTFFQVVYDQRTIESIEAPHKGLLTFCDKYEINSVLRKIFAYLLHSFPDTLEAWKLARNKRKTEEAVIIAAAAFKTDTKTVLPSCLYTIMIDPNHKKIAVAGLPKDLLVKYYRGLVEFSSYAAEFYTNTLCRRVTPPKGCNKAKCKEIWTGFQSRVQSRFLNDSDHIRFPNPLRYLEDLSKLAVSEYHLYCDRCRTALPEIFENAEEEVWRSLPSTFGIADDWGTLKQEYSY